MARIGLIGIGVLASALAAGDAQACDGAGSLRTIFFEQAPAGVAASVIAQVTTLETATQPANNAFVYAARARVDRVVKGAIASTVVNLVGPATSCDQQFGAGRSGFVAGEIRRGAGGQLELVALTRRGEGGGESRFRRD